MEPLLKTIAREYSKRYPGLKDLCFVFPNKRCGTFLRKYFSEYDVHTEDLPHILTITELMSQLALKTEAKRIEQLFTLYNSYLKILEQDKNEKTTVDFESFRMWGETVLSDFNTVDLNLVDPDEIFKNVKDYREITTDFLTDDQKEVMKEYFGIDTFDAAGNFWKNFSGQDELSSLKSKFLNLWQILSPLHDDFIKSLSERGLGTAGSIYRQAYERVREKGRGAFPYKKIIAVGFNALSESERRIFKEIRDFDGYPGYDEFIDFVWDATGPVLSSEISSASRFVDYNRRHFPSPQWLDPILQREDVKEFPEIRIISAPSNSAQAKVAGELLKEYDDREGLEKLENAEVAVVLPDESLLPNILYSIPDEVGILNLTMGLSMRNTSVSLYISLLRRVYSNMRETKKTKLFYVKDLRMLFSHPYSYILSESDGVGRLLEYIDTYHKVTVSQEEIEGFIDNARDIFSFPSKKERSTKVFSFMKSIFNLLKEKMDPESNHENEKEISEVEIYEEYISGLEETLKYYKIEMLPLSLMYLSERLVAAETIGFEGEPLMGLQLMGTLETRSIDFKDLIILSMNEGIMPRKSFTSTFIPETLRHAYGLPPARYAEEIFGYYFFRMISRAKRVSLIYDGRTVSGMRGGESRYLLQLRQYCPDDKLKEVSWQYHLQSREKEDASVRKTPEIKKMIDYYTRDEEPMKNFSASALNSYRECQVRFFFQNVLNISNDPEKGEYMDAISVGNILHEVMMDLYMPEAYRRKLLSRPLIIEKSQLEAYLDSPVLIRDLIQQKISTIYYGETEGSGLKVNSGVTDIIAAQIEELVREIVKHDLSLAPFNLYGCEISRNIKVEFPSGRKVNFRFAIDRLDEIEYDGERRLRIVDYKTGQRKRKASDLTEVFAGCYQSEQIFQLFVYAWLLKKIGMPGSDDVMTEIYFVPDMIKGEDGLPVLEEGKVTGYGKYSEEFSKKLEELIEDIFTSDVFRETADCQQCTYCAFKSICKK